MPAGAVAMSPVADFAFSGDSVQRNDGVDDMFSTASMDALVPVYLGTPELRSHPYVSPVFGDYTGLPPLLLIVGSTELLLGDAVRVAYLVLAVLTGLVPMALLAIAPPLAMAMWAQPMFWAATLAVGALMLLDAAAVGWRRLSGCLAAALVLGPGCGLSVFLCMREVQLGRRLE